MSNIKSTSDSILLLTFAQKLAEKLDTNPAFDQCFGCMDIVPLVQHKAAVECEKNIDAFGLLDINAVSGQAVQDAVKEYLGTDIMDRVDDALGILERLTGWSSDEESDYLKELKAILGDSNLREIMSPTSEYSRPEPSLWTCYRELKDACQYLTRDKRYCDITETIRNEERKDLRRKFKRTKFFTKDKETGSYRMTDDGIEQFFGESDPYLSKFAGTEVQVTQVDAIRDEAGHYIVHLTFRDDCKIRLGYEVTFTDVAETLVRRVTRHYESILEVAVSQAEKGLPVTSGYPDGTEEHKLAVLKRLNYELPEELTYQVYWRTDNCRWNTYKVLPAGQDTEEYVSICEPTTYTLATELEAAKYEEYRVAEQIRDAEIRVIELSRKLLEKKQVLAELEVKKFDAKAAIDKAQNNIAQ